MMARVYNPGVSTSQLDIRPASATSLSVTAFPGLNRTKASMPATAITGGGSKGDEQLIGYHHNRVELSGPGSTFVWPFIPVGAPSTLRVFKLDKDRVYTNLTSPTHWTAEIDGSTTVITLVTPLVATDILVVEDKATLAESPATDLGYAWIGGGYDNVIYAGVMQQCTGAHHRIMGGDHGTIVGGSYSTIKRGSYGAIVGGSFNEIDGVGVGSAIIGGIRNRITGSCATVIGSQSSKAVGAFSAVVGGTLNTASGTASVILGRSNSVSGSDSIAIGSGHNVTGNFSQAGGQSHLIQHHYSGVLGGRGITTKWAGERVDWGYRDATVGTNVLRKVFSVDLSKFTSDAAWARLETLNAITALVPPDGVVWLCRLNLAARSGGFFGAAFESRFAIQRTNTTTTFIGGVAPTVTTIAADVSFGVGSDGPAVAVAIDASGGVEVSVRSRQDQAVSAKWFGWLEIVEVG